MQKDGLVECHLPFIPAAALPRQRIELHFNRSFYMEASFECRFDHIEVRDAPFSFSPLIDRFCGTATPGLVVSSGRFVWVRFYSDDELEGQGFQVQYHFTTGRRFTPPLGVKGSHEGRAPSGR